MPLSDKYLSLVRGLFPQNAKTAPVLIPIENAGAIVEKERAYESFDIPTGTLRGSPPVPEDDVTTLQVSFYLVGKKSLDIDLLYALGRRIRQAENESDLSEIESQIDDVLRAQRARADDDDRAGCGYAKCCSPSS